SEWRSATEPDPWEAGWWGAQGYLQQAWSFLQVRSRTEQEHAASSGVMQGDEHGRYTLRGTSAHPFQPAWYAGNGWPWRPGVSGLQRHAVQTKRMAVS